MLSLLYLCGGLRTLGKDWARSLNTPCEHAGNRLWTSPATFTGISQPTHRSVSAVAGTMTGMSQLEGVQSKISARDRAQRLMDHLTAGVAVVAVAGVGVLGYVSAATIPGSTSSAAATTSTSTSASTSTSSASSTSSPSSSGLSSSGTVSSSSGSSV